MAATAVTLNDLEGHNHLQTLSNVIRRTFVEHFTRFQLTVDFYLMPMSMSMSVPSCVPKKLEIEDRRTLFQLSVSLAVIVQFGNISSQSIITSSP